MAGSTWNEGKSRTPCRVPVMPVICRMPTYAWQIRFDVSRERLLEVRPAHRAYLASLHQRGKLRISGPWADDEGALIVFTADDEAEARSLAAGDPFTTEGVAVELSLREWNVVFPPSE